MNTINCPLCESSLAKELFWAREYVLFEKTKFRLVRCDHCRLVFLNPQPSNEELKRYYPTEYFSAPEDKFRLNAPSIILLDKVKEIGRFKKKGKLLDVGCGPGFFLDQMKKRGWEVYGIDPAPAACQLASEKIGKDNVFNGDLFSVNLPKKCYDVITLWHVIEHLDNPVESLKKARDLLKNDGILIVCCPNFDSLLRRIFNEKWYALSIPHHLFHFTPQTLICALNKTGYRVKMRKKHFVDPLTNMGSLKMSLLRSIGPSQMTGLTPLRGKDRDGQSDRPVLWRMARFALNMVTLALSLVFSLIGSEDVMLVWAVKEEEK